MHQLAKMARKKKSQKHAVNQVNEESSSLLRVEVSRPKNQNQLKNMTPSDGGKTRCEVVVSPAPPPHLRNGPPSKELLETIQPYHDSVRLPNSSPQEVQGIAMRSPLMFEALEYYQENRSQGGTAMEKVRLLMRTVNEALDLMAPSVRLEKHAVVGEIEQLHTEQSVGRCCATSSSEKLESGSKNMG